MPLDGKTSDILSNSCDAGQKVFGSGVCGRCTVPANLSDVVRRELRDAFQESKRRGHILIRE